jgi:hypothetical protein
MSESKCSRNDEDSSTDKLAGFAKCLLKSLVLLSIVIGIYFLKLNYFKSGSEITPLDMLLFILLSTMLLTILGAVDTYIFNNVILGLGIGLGVSLFNFE